MDLSPLRTSREFRLLFTSQAVTLLGSQATQVALLFQAKELTGSTLAVGLLGVAELVPIVVFALYGGLLADRLDRRTVARLSEAGLCAVALLLAVNAALPHPALWALYAGAAAIVSLTALQRPSLTAAVPRLVAREQLTAASALLAMAANASFILGAAVGGVLAAGPGPAFAFGLDAATFALSLVLLLGLPRLIRVAGEGEGEARGIAGLLAGIRYARGRQELLGSYLADLLAMTLAFPVALFPFMAAELDAEWALGLMFAGPAVGAMLASATSRWAGRVHRHGLAVAVSAACWGAAIAGFGLAPNIGLALGFLVAAGAADMLSGVFRDTLWHQTIPDAMRGRLAGIEVVSYGLGPSAGQLRAGAVAGLVGTRAAVWSGGLACVAAVAATCALLPRFVSYERERQA
jgi:MFS family permease